MKSDLGHATDLGHSQDKNKTFSPSIHSSHSYKHPSITGAKKYHSRFKFMEGQTCPLWSTWCWSTSWSKTEDARLGQIWLWYGRYLWIINGVWQHLGQCIELEPTWGLEIGGTTLQINEAFQIAGISPIYNLFKVVSNLLEVCNSWMMVKQQTQSI